jgi:hypothetical protein
MTWLFSDNVARTELDPFALLVLQRIKSYILRRLRTSPPDEPGKIFPPAFWGLRPWFYPDLGADHLVLEDFERFWQ